MHVHHIRAQPMQLTRHVHAAPAGAPVHGLTAQLAGVANFLNRRGNIQGRIHGNGQYVCHGKKRITAP